VLYFSYYYHKTSTAVYPVPRYFFTVNTVDEIVSTAHPYFVVLCGPLRCLVVPYILCRDVVGEDVVCLVLLYALCVLEL